MSARPRFILLQVRNPGDPMRDQEVRCFARQMQCDQRQIEVWDLLSGVPTREHFDQADVVLLGGSGDYSVAEGGAQVERALDAMRELCEWSKPTFASCWGFQAMARALGGEVVTDLARAELGTVEVRLTPEGTSDPVFGYLGTSTTAQMGHQDVVTRLPDVAIRLAYSDRVANQAFRVDGKPIYCTQFHPELDRPALVERLRIYPQYVKRIADMPADEFCVAHCHETPETNRLLKSFLHWLRGEGYLPGGKYE